MQQAAFGGLLAMLSGPMMIHAHGHLELIYVGSFPLFLAAWIRFVDRTKDCIRRRGENIAATEVEAAIGQLAGIEEVAAYPVPSSIPGGEDELMLAIVAASGITLPPEQIMRIASELAESVQCPAITSVTGNPDSAISIAGSASRDRGSCPPSSTP